MWRSCIGFLISISFLRAEGTENCQVFLERIGTLGTITAQDFQSEPALRSFTSLKSFVSELIAVTTKLEPKSGAEIKAKLVDLLEQIEEVMNFGVMDFGNFSVFRGRAFIAYKDIEDLNVADGGYEAEIDRRWNEDSIPDSPLRKRLDQIFSGPDTESWSTFSKRYPLIATSRKGRVDSEIKLIREYLALPGRNLLAESFNNLSSDSTALAQLVQVVARWHMEEISKEIAEDMIKASPTKELSDPSSLVNIGRFIAPKLGGSMVDRLLNSPDSFFLRPRKMKDGDLWIVHPAVQLSVWFDNAKVPTKVVRMKLITIDENTLLHKFPAEAVAPASFSAIPSPKVSASKVEPASTMKEKVEKPALPLKPIIYDRNLAPIIVTEAEKLNKDYPGSEKFLAEWAQWIDENPLLMEPNHLATIKRKTMYLLKQFPGDSEEQMSRLIMITMGIEEAQKRKAHAIASNEDSKTSGRRTLNELVVAENFSLDQMESGKEYSFRFVGGPDIGEQKVLITKDALQFMRENRHQERWLRYFLRRASKEGESGLKTLARDGDLATHLNATHEVKILGHKSNFRIAVRFDETRHLWVIMKGFDKDL